MNNFLTDNIRCAAIFSPAGKPDADALKRGISLLESCGIKVKVMPHAFGSSTPHPDYLAAADDERASDFMQAYLDEETDILIASRGGYGCGRILERLDWQKLKSAKQNRRRLQRFDCSFLCNGTPQLRNSACFGHGGKA